MQPPATRLRGRQPPARVPPGRSEQPLPGAGPATPLPAQSRKRGPWWLRRRPLPATAGRRPGGRRRSGRSPPLRRRRQQRRPSARSAAAGTAGRRATAAVPRSVTGATSAAAATFAGKAYAPNCGCSSTIAGPQKSWADRGTATPAAAQRGTGGGSQSMMRRPATTIPSVARTESRNPKLVARTGSASSRPMTATHSRLSPRAARPKATDARPMLPMSAARSTLGSGPTMRTNSPSPARLAAAAAGRGRRSVRAASSRVPRIRLQFAPLTAVRCVIPTVFMAPSNSGFRALVSPVTMPGRSPLASPPYRAAAAVNARRSSPGPCCKGPGPRSTAGADEAERIPAADSPGAAGRSFPVARSRWPGTSVFPRRSTHDDEPGVTGDSAAVQGHHLQRHGDGPAVRQAPGPGSPEPARGTCDLDFRDDSRAGTHRLGDWPVMAPGRFYGRVGSRRDGQQQRHSQRGAKAAWGRLSGTAAPSVALLRRLGAARRRCARTSPLPVLAVPTAARPANEQEDAGGRRQGGAETGKTGRGQPVSSNGGPPDQEGWQDQPKVRPTLPFRRAPMRGPPGRRAGDAGAEREAHRGAPAKLPSEVPREARCIPAGLP